MKLKKILVTALSVIMATAILAGCGNTAAPSSSEAAPSSEAAADDEAAAGDGIIRMGMLEVNSIEMNSITGKVDAMTAMKDEKNSHFEKKIFTTLNSLVLDLKAGRLTCAILPASVGNYLSDSDADIKVETGKRTSNFHMATRPADKELNTKLSTAIDDLKKDGTIDELSAKYMGAATDPEKNVLSKKEGAETYKVAVTGDLPPMDYVNADGTPAGFNIALLNAISEKAGCNFEIIQVEAPARLPALESEKADIVFWMNCFLQDEEGSREQDGALLTSPYYTEPMGLAFYGQFPMDDLMKIAEKINAVE